MCSAPTHVRFTPNSDRESRHPQPVMSASPPKADMCGAIAYVCYGPIADIEPKQAGEAHSKAAGERNIKGAMQRFAILFEIDRQGWFATSPRIFGDIRIVFKIK